ncbi:MAG: cupredoxin domain-containing protein [Actinomycetota bacterium]
MRKLVQTALAGLALTLVAAPAGAGTTEEISIVSPSVGFDPATVTSTFGTTFNWTNDGTISHTTTQDGPLELWSSGILSPGESFSVILDAAGIYRYHCTVHPTTMQGAIRIPVTIDPASGSQTTTFSITIASVRAPEGLAYDVQKRKGNGDWTIFRSEKRVRVVRFHPASSGTFSFRSRLHDTSSDATSKWSPKGSITVS